jgi:hypothetical protein
MGAGCERPEVKFLRPTHPYVATWTGFVYVADEPVRVLTPRQATDRIDYSTRTSKPHGCRGAMC